MRLGAIPLGVAVVLTMLLLPRRAAPAFDDVPVPVPDAHALAHSAAIDHDLAERARQETLPGAVRAVGSALRAYHELEAAGADPGALVAARRAIDSALSDARAGASAEASDAALLRLRALELEGFLVEVRRFEATGTPSDEFVALAGDFTAAMTKAGWCEGHALLPREDALRTMYKEMWNGLVGVEGRPGFEASLDEERALYAVFLAAPHPSSAARDAIDAARRGAADAKSCLAVVEAERSAAEAWRADRIARFAAIDPTYPAAYALGVTSYRRGDYRAAARSFRTWLDGHADGPLTLRARAFLRAADGQSSELE
ncbi:MAG TPA: hypothetical protein VHV30_17215 [Polyangiaceae bacterium]|nr:hypothetical protein [Polyangiaceae bacterium]